MSWWDTAFDWFWRVFLLGTLFTLAWVAFRLTGVCR